MEKVQILNIEVYRTMDGQINMEGDLSEGCEPYEVLAACGLLAQHIATLLNIAMGGGMQEIEVYDVDT